MNGPLPSPCEKARTPTARTSPGQNRHTGASRYPFFYPRPNSTKLQWTPAYAGVTDGVEAPRRGQRKSRVGDGCGGTSASRNEDLMCGGVTLVASSKSIRGVTNE